MEEMLWDYIDGGGDAGQISFIERLLETDAAWQGKYKELLDVHRLMQESITLDEPSMRFTQNVMEEISRLYITPAASNYINKNVIRGIGIFFLITIVGLLVYSFGQTNWSETGSVPGMDKLNVGRFDWSRLYNSTYTNIFIMVNIVLGLMLVDMYLTRKKKAQAG